MNASKTLFTSSFSKVTYLAEKYVKEAIKAFDTKDFDQFWEMVSALDRMEKRGVISGNWSQNLYNSAAHHKPDWFREREEEYFSF